MAAKNKNKLIASAIMVVVATVIVYACAVRSKLLNEARRPAANLTAQQVADRSAPICRLLAPGGGQLHQTAEPLMRVLRDGTMHKIWAVDCIDAAGHSVVHTVWDAESGNMLVVSHEPKRGAFGKPNTLSALGAAKAAWRWMESMGIAHIAPRWTLAQAPALHSNTWQVELTSPKYTATVLCDKDTQDLVYIVVKEIDQTGRAA